MLFEPGQSGNPAGRPRGARNKRTILAEKLLDEDADGLTRAAIELAKKCHPAALRICMDRVFPAGKHRPATFELPQIANAVDAIGAMGRIVQAVADGDLTAVEATEMSRLVHGLAQSATAAALEPRVAALESDAATKKKLERLRRGR